MTVVVPFTRDACFGALCNNDRCPIHGDPAAMTNTERMAALALTFPTIADWSAGQAAPGAWPFEPERLDAWAFEGRCSHAAVFAARFLLSVWTGHAARQVGRPRARDGLYRFTMQTAWRSGPFDAVDAMGTWDKSHRSAFLRWAARPWWP